MLTAVCFALLLHDVDQARAVLALAAAHAAQKPTVQVEQAKPVPKETRPTKPQGRPVRPLLQAAQDRYPNLTPEVVEGGQRRLEQPLRWAAKPGWHQLDLMHGNVQVGAYNTRTKVYRPYDAETDTWGVPEDPPLTLPRVQSSAPVFYREASRQNC